MPGPSILLLTLLALCACSHTAPAPTEAAPGNRPRASDASPAREVRRLPEGYHPIAAPIEADINSDGEADRISEVESSDLPRALAIELSVKGRLELHLLSEELSFSDPEYDTGTGTLTLKNAAGGAHARHSARAQFRFQDGEFLLIRSSYSRSGLNEACGDSPCFTETTGTDYLSGKRTEEHTGDDGKSSSTASNIPQAPLIRLRDFRFEMLEPPEEGY